MPARYTDFYVDFTIHPIKGDLALQQDVVAISSSIKNIVFTDHYERFWQPKFGAGVPQTLFENMTSDTQFLLETRIHEAIKNFEPRAIDVVVQVVASVDRNAYEATIFYTPINSSARATVQAIFRRVR